MRVSATTNLSDPKIMQWDGDFWGFNVANANHLDGLSEWAVENTVGLVCLLIDANDPQQVQKAEEHGFRFMDVRVTLECSLLNYYKSMFEHPIGRFVEDNDTEVLCSIGRDAFLLTRFYADPSLDNERCGDLYAEWTRTLCEDSPDAVIVVERDDHPVGYVTVSLEDDSDGLSSIGLIAVAADYRGQRVGSELVIAAKRWASEYTSNMRVVTQGRNIGALRTFESCGFRIVKTELWFHKRYA